MHASLSISAQTGLPHVFSQFSSDHACAIPLGDDPLFFPRQRVPRKLAATISNFRFRVCFSQGHVKVLRHASAALLAEALRPLPRLLQSSVLFFHCLDKRRWNSVYYA